MYFSYVHGREPGKLSNILEQPKPLLNTPSSAKEKDICLGGIEERGTVMVGVWVKLGKERCHGPIDATHTFSAKLSL